MSIDLPKEGSIADSLTRHEWTGLMSRHNLADGHARQAQTEAMSDVVARLPELYMAAEAGPQLQAQRAFEESFYGLAGQISVLGSPLGPLHHYSSSLSIEVVANLLRECGSRVGLIHPTFDNISAILARHQVPRVAISESIFASPHDAEHYRDCDAVFLVVPNNPTGLDPSVGCIKEIARQCQQRDLLLIVDFSFRFFSATLADWDQYAFFESIGVRYIGIEDTGKTWPTLDLKVGSLNCVADLRPRLQEITDDLLLNVSPFIFTLIREYIEADKEVSARELGRGNRDLLSASLTDLPVTLLPTDGPMSVAWLRLPDEWHAGELCDFLAKREITVLPGPPFFWADAALGDRYIRIALMRPQDEFVSAVTAFAGALGEYRRARTSVGGRRAEVEALVLKLVAELLDRPDVTLRDDFFVLGGDSMSAMHLVGRVSQATGVPQRVRTLFDGPVLEAFAARVAENCDRQGPAGAQPPADPLARLRMSFANQSAGSGRV